MNYVSISHLLSMSNVLKNEREFLIIGQVASVADAETVGRLWQGPTQPRKKMVARSINLINQVGTRPG
jgi:hypothetical protein